MIKTAVILAAGLGSRFKEMTIDRPKGFINFMGKSMIQRSIENLIESGIEKIVIGVGHQSHWFEKLQLQYPQIICCKIDRYFETGSLFTLFSCRHLIDTDFLLLESDIVYEPNAINQVVNCSNMDVVLTTSVIKFQDQFYVEQNEKAQLVNCSFSADDLNKIDGEWVGINKISIASFYEICKIIESNHLVYEKAGYEKIFLNSKLTNCFYVKCIPNLLWYEIDDEEDLFEAIRIFSYNYKNKKDCFSTKI